MNALVEHQIFRSIAEQGSLIGAALALDMPRSTISKRLGDLERRLGQQLFHRTTRRVALTSAGQALLERVGPALDAIARAERDVQAEASGQGDTLVLSAPPALAQNVLGVLAGEILKRRGNLRVEVRSRLDHDPARDADVDVRMTAHPTGRPPTGSEVVGYSRRALYAAPSLLATRPPSARLQEVPPGDIVIRSPLESLILTKGSKRWTLICNGPLVCLDHETVRDAVITGAFIGVLPQFMALPHVASGLLVPVFTEWRFPDVPLAITLSRRAHDHLAVADLLQMLPAALRRAGLIV